MVRLAQPASLIPTSQIPRSDGSPTLPMARANLGLSLQKAQAASLCPHALTFTAGRAEKWSHVQRSFSRMRQLYECHPERSVSNISRRRKVLEDERDVHQGEHRTYNPPFTSHHIPRSSFPSYLIEGSDCAMLGSRANGVDKIL